MPRYIFEFDALAIVAADTEAEARETLAAMIIVADTTGMNRGGSLSLLDNYTIYDEQSNEVHPDDLEG